MNQSPSASSVNAGTPQPSRPQIPSWPHPATISLTIQLEVQSSEQYDSIFETAPSELAMPFIGDLFDLLGSDYGLPITSINGKTFKDVQHYFESTIK